jgi:glycosyltransferase involved in cell wall biosynthesis
MRILHTVNIGFLAGGAEKSVNLLATEQTRRGHDVRIVATDLLAPGPGQPVFAHDLFPALRGGSQRLFGLFWNRRAYRMMRELVSDFQPEVVNHHTIGEFSPSIIAACRGRAQIMSAHGPEDWTLGFLKWTLATATRPEGLSAVDRLRYLRLRWVQRPAYRMQFRHVDRFVAVSRFMAESIVPDAGRIPVFVVPNCVEPGFAPGPVTNADRVLYSGRLERVKGVEFLLEAFRKVLADHPAARLSLAGEGSDRARLEESAADLVAAGSVRFLGWLSREALAEQIAQSSVVVVPSLWPEVFGRVLLDAFATGRPVIASRVGALPELVGEDRGLLVEPGDSTALAGALGELLGDLERLERMGEAARAYSERFAIDKVVHELEAHYADAIANGRSV